SASYFAALAFFGLFMALGSANPFYRIVPYLPGFNLFKAPARYLYLSSFGLAMLSGFGLQGLLGGPGAGVRRRGGALLALLVGAGAVLAAIAGSLLRSRVRELASAHLLPRLIGSEGRTRPPEYYAAQFAHKWDPYYAHRLEDLAFLATL